MKFTIEPSDSSLVSSNYSSGTASSGEANDDDDLVSVWTYPPGIVSNASIWSSSPNADTDKYKDLVLEFDFDRIEQSCSSEFGIKIMLPSNALKYLSVQGLDVTREVSVAKYSGETVVELDVKPGFTKMHYLYVAGDGVLVHADLSESSNTDLSEEIATLTPIPTDVGMGGNSIGIFETGKFSDTETLKPSFDVATDENTTVYINGDISGSLYWSGREGHPCNAVVVINGKIDLRSNFSGDYYCKNTTTTVVTNDCTTLTDGGCRQVNDIHGTIFAPNNIVFRTDNDPMTIVSTFSLCGPIKNAIQHKKTTRTIVISLCAVGFVVFVVAAVITVITVAVLSARKKKRDEGK